MTQAVGVYRGRVPNPHILYGQNDIETAPVTFNRYGTRWGDVQLKNGWWDTDWGRRNTAKGAHFMAAITPTIPGQTRLSGTQPANFPMRGPAPSQWDYHVNSTVGSQPNYPGGPGYIMGTPNYVGSSGG